MIWSLCTYPGPAAEGETIGGYEAYEDISEALRILFKKENSGP